MAFGFEPLAEWIDGAGWALIMGAVAALLAACSTPPARQEAARPAPTGAPVQDARPASAPPSAPAPPPPPPHTRAAIAPRSPP